MVRPTSRAIWRQSSGEMSRPAWKGTGGGPPIQVPELLVRPALAYFNEPQAFEASDDLTRLENGPTCHG